MKEVSVKVLDVIFRELRRRRIEASPILEGTGCTLQQLRNKHERIDWSVFVRILSNSRQFWPSEEALVALGGTSLRAPYIRPIALIARLLFSARDTYRWVLSEGSGAGNQMFTCIRPAYQEVGPNRIIGELTLADGYEPCPEFFLLCQGSFIDFPRVLALGPSTVTMEATARHARYEIVFPTGGGALAWLRKAVTWPFTVRAAGRELKEAHEVLQTRYHELDHARNVLALQATQLSTAHSISQVIRGDLDLDHTLRAVAGALTDVAGFAAAEIRLGVDLDGRRIERTEGAGARPPGAEALRFPLEGRGRTSGELLLWAAAASEEPRLRELLQVVLPTVAMALDDALTYTALADYRENLERRVAERTAELREARDSLADTVSRLESAQQARDRIFANINHEIRTPLSLIMLAVADIKKRQGHLLDDRARRELAGVELGVRRLLRLVDGLLLLAAGQEGKLRLRIAPADVATMLQLLVSAWAPAAEAQGLSLTYRGPGRCRIAVDEAALERVATNLVSNAIKFTPRGGSVEVELVEAAAEAQIAVRDTGIGIDDEFRGRIFGRFEQGRPSVRPGTRGSGIGLSLVKELVEAHGGRVAVESPRGGGSVFRVTLPSRHVPPSSDGAEAAVEVDPRQRTTPEDFGLKTAEAQPEVIEANGSPQATVLVAEDEPELREAIARLLREDYRILAAPDGMTALRLAQRHLPDLLVTDIGMPGMDGLELTRRFRELPGNRLAPVVLLTAFANLSDRLSGFEAGAVDYVSKPFEPEELRARIRSQLALRALALKLHQSEKLAALGTLSAGLAHEMRNPANAIVNAIEPLRELLPAPLTAQGAPTAQLLDVLKGCADQIAVLSRQLLGFRRPGELEREEQPFGHLYSRAMALVQPAFRGVELREALAYQGVVWCAAPLVTQVLANLLENGAHAAGAGGWVRLGTRIAGDRLVVEVSDSGPGVPAELRERIFEPFFTTKPPGAGNGLGLTTAREIAERHGGILEVRDAERGSIFHLEIPCVRPLRAADGRWMAGAR